MNWAALLVRSGKGVQPTVYGKNVLEYAKLILRATATISSLAVPDEQNGLRLSAYPSNMVSRLLVDFTKPGGLESILSTTRAPWRRSPTMSTKGISEVGIVYVAQKQVPTFQHILLHKKLEFIPQSEKEHLCLRRTSAPTVSCGQCGLFRSSKSEIHAWSTGFLFYGTSS